MDDNSEEKGLFGTIGKVVGNLIFEQTDGPEDEKPEVSAETQSQAEGNPADIEKEPAIAPRETVVPADPKIYQKLKAAVDGKGNAFSQFCDMLESMADVIDDEALRYAAALKAVGKSYGITPDQIIRSIDVKLGALDEEKEKFSATLNKRMEEMGEFQGKILQKDKEIESLKQQIAKIEEEKKEIERAVSEKTAKIEMVRKDFFSAADMLKMEISGQKEIVVKYLQGGKQ